MILFKGIKSETLTGQQLIDIERQHKHIKYLGNNIYATDLHLTELSNRIGIKFEELSIDEL